MAHHRHIRHGVGAVRPYIYGNLDLPNLIKRAFDAEEVERLASSKGFHIEAKIGDSVLVLEVGEFPPTASPTRNSIYVYVPDVDSSYQRAIEAGATSISPPTDQPYQERSAGIKDSFGNVWYIATYTG